MMNNWNDVKQKLNHITFDIAKIKASNIILFGAAMKGALALKTMRTEGYKVVAFSDNNFIRFSGSGRYEGLPVIEPDKIGDIPDAFVIITVTGHLYNAIRRQLDELGYPNLTHMELMLFSHEEDYHKVYADFLRDEKSRNVFENILLGHLEGDEHYFREVYENGQYFAIPEFDQILWDEIYVDCGAYVGDSIENYIFRKSGAFKKIYAFEPVRSSCLAMRKRVERLNEEWNFPRDKIECLHYAVGKAAAEGHINLCENLASGNHVGTSENNLESETVQIISLDDFFENKEEIPTFIKVDIEGEELQMIYGTQKLIAKHKPKLAICVYHRDEDLYELPMELKRLNPEYRFALRHHKPQFNESVLYCW